MQTRACKRNRDHKLDMEKNITKEKLGVYWNRLILRSFQSYNLQQYL